MRLLKKNPVDPYAPTISQYNPGLDKANLKKLRELFKRKPPQPFSGQEIQNVRKRILKTNIH